MAQDPYTDGTPMQPNPPFVRGMGFKDIGSSGLRQFGGYVREEFLPQLQGREAARVYREMSDNSATIGAMLFAIVQSMRKIDWRTEPASDKPDALAEAEFADSLRMDMSHTWDEFIAESLSMLPYGFAPHEIVYKRRLGPKKEGTNSPTSKYSDGRVGWRRLPIRGQDTVIKWYFDPNGTITGLQQQPWNGGLIDIPIEKLLLFRPTTHKNNPEGRSILRNSYRAYYMQTRLEDQEAVLFERLAGLPVMKVPLDLLTAAGGSSDDPETGVAITALNEYKKIVTNVRIDEQMGIIIPSDTFEAPDGTLSNVPMYSFDLISPKGRINVNADVSIERYKLDQLMSVLADFISVGHAQRGTQSLALSKVDMFFQAIEGWLTSEANIINRYGLTRIWDLNNINYDLMPAFVPELAQRIDLDSLGNYVLHLAQAGAAWFPDEDLENWLRDAAGMPDVADARAFSPAAVQAMGSEGVKKLLMASFAKRVKQIRSEAP
jgi:hypothetical protein